MIKRILVLIGTFSIIIILAFPIKANVKLENNFPKYDSTIDLNKLAKLINSCEQHMNYAEDLVEAALNLGYQSTHPVIKLGQSEYQVANRHYQLYTIKYQNWKAKWEEYPIATEIWTYLKSLGYSDNICAGIMGNMMTEAGGNNLNIQYNLYSKNKIHYGICQWNINYYKEIADTDLKTQLNFLSNNIVFEFNNFGYIYSDNFDYLDFTNLKSYEDVALIFAKCYERCSSSTYIVRIENAKKAYEYFTS